MKRDLFLLAGLLLAPLAATTVVGLLGHTVQRTYVISLAALGLLGLSLCFSLRNRRVGLLLLSAVAVSVGIGCLTFQVYPHLFAQPASIHIDYLDIRGISEGVDRTCVSYLASGIALLLGWIPLWLYLKRASEPPNKSLEP
jgi:hypothetical protein